MIQHVYERANMSRYLSNVLVATDDDRIAKAVHKFGGRVRMTRADHPSGTDRVAEVAFVGGCRPVSSTSKATNR